MFGILENLAKAAVGAVVLPVRAVADVATLGGELTDRGESYTGEGLSDIMKALEKATKPE